MTPTTDTLSAAAGYARELNVADPADVLARRGVELQTFPDPLDLPGKLAWGIWHPSIRRIELFGCNAERSDRDVLLCLAHEIGHMDRAGRFPPGDEQLADEFAERLVDRLSPARVGACARALRRMARPAPSASCVKRVSPNPICISP